MKQKIAASNTSELFAVSENRFTALPLIVTKKHRHSKNVKRTPPHRKLSKIEFEDLFMWTVCHTGRVT